MSFQSESRILKKTVKKISEVPVFKKAHYSHKTYKDIVDKKRKNSVSEHVKRQGLSTI